MHEEISLKIGNATEIVSVSQARWLLRKYAKGCNPDCLACHFSEFFVRDLHPDHIESVLEGEYQVTELPSHGFQTVPMGSTRGLQDRQIPDGIYFHIVSLRRRNDSLRDITLMIGARWDLNLTESHVCDIWNHFIESLPRDEDGYPIVPPLIEEAPHPGRQLDQLPTRPLTPLNGRPRTSFSRPPPQYSPRPNFRGQDLRHPREVIPEDGHQAPFYPNHQTPAPPTYEGSGSGPPSYSPIRRRASYVSRRASQATLARRRHARVPPRLQHQDAFVASGSRGSRGSMNEIAEGYLNWLSRQTSVILDSPGGAPRQVSSPSALVDFSSWLDEFEDQRITEDPQTMSPALASSQLRSGRGTFPQTFLDMSPDSPIVDESHPSTEASDTETSRSESDSDTSTQRAARDEPGWPFTFLPEMAHDQFATSPYITIVPVKYAVNEEEGVHYMYVRGSIARAVLNTYPWRYRPLTMAELEDAAAHIDHLKKTLGATIGDEMSEPRAQIDNPPAATCLRDPILTLPLDDRNDILQLAQNSIDGFEPGTVEFQRQIEFFVHQAFEEMLSHDPFALRLFSETEEYDEWGVDSMRKMMIIIKLERETRKHDCETEASATLVREQLAAAMGLDISTVLAPYDLDSHIRAGNVAHQDDWLRTDNQFLIQLRLHQLPESLQIWTIDAVPSRIPHPDPELDSRLATNPAYELPSQRITDPFEQLSNGQQAIVIEDIVYEIANEIVQVHKDEYLLAIATAFLKPETPLTIDVLRGVLSAVRGVRAMRIPVETVSAVFGAEESGGVLGDVFGVTSAEPHASREDAHTAPSAAVAAASYP